MVFFATLGNGQYSEIDSYSGQSINKFPPNGTYFKWRELLSTKRSGEDFETQHRPYRGLLQSQNVLAGGDGFNLVAFHRVINEQPGSVIVALDRAIITSRGWHYGHPTRYVSQPGGLPQSRGRLLSLLCCKSVP